MPYWRVKETFVKKSWGGVDSFIEKFKALHLKGRPVDSPLVVIGDFLELQVKINNKQ